MPSPVVNSAGQNVFTPPAYMGVSGQQGDYIASDFTYLYNVTLTSNQVITNDGVLIYTDADFAITAVIITQNTGIFSVQFTDASGYQLSSAYLYSASFYQGGVPIPFPFMPAVLIPAGGRIGVNIQDASGSTNVIQIAFRGFKKFSVVEGS